MNPLVALCKISNSFYFVGYSVESKALAYLVLFFKFLNFSSYFHRSNFLTSLLGIVSGVDSYYFGFFFFLSGFILGISAFYGAFFRGFIEWLLKEEQRRYGVVRFFEIYVVYDFLLNVEGRIEKVWRCCALKFLWFMIFFGILAFLGGKKPCNTFGNL